DDASRNYLTHDANGLQHDHQIPGAAIPRRTLGCRRRPYQQRIARPCGARGDAFSVRGVILRGAYRQPAGESQSTIKRELGRSPMIIDIHGHYTTAPQQHEKWRQAEIQEFTEGKQDPPLPPVSDDEIRGSIVNGQLKVQKERGTDVTIFSPRAAGMGHHLGNAETSEVWADACNKLIYRV